MYTYDNNGNTIDLTQTVKQEVPSIDALQVLENEDIGLVEDSSQPIFKQLLNWRVGIILVLAVLIVIFLVKENGMKKKTASDSGRSKSSSSSSISLSSRKSSKKIET
jgi:hypothetical protein